ncbi:MULTISPECIES: glycoside hydrolase family 3 N-terminal domain-containing protein [Pseudomonas]|jgi:beta-glucosidase|uniref:glycoside hydrolase family 3 N-terminal domain-containing protein n=1 Tax=Pseudomonas TaxID=286 RepID=UPI0008E0C85A|nr:MULTISPECIES: glycoside hydrolase family 3 N-terminal domain-containing protein [Pseudomonas]QDH63582.1 glycosyl hydrolase [Pseudomonas azotoformans]SFS25471.1 beta-glucosidase [Pseudomonas sp. NFACC42-2]
MRLGSQWALLCLALNVSGNALHAGEQDPVEALLQQMTLEEKVAQLNQLGVQDTPTGPVIDPGELAQLPMSTVGSVLGAYGVEQTRRLQEHVVTRSRLPIPLLFAFDVIHGFRTVFPVPLAEAAAWDPDLAQRTARAAAVEATASGIHWTFAPMIDIARDPRWGRVVEGTGEDPFLGAALASAKVRGFHGAGPADPSYMLATAKHFVTYGAAEGGRDYNVADVSERTLREVYLPPFQAAVAAGVDGIMPSFNELAGTPLHSNTALLTGVLRNQWRFRGLIVSDFNALWELSQHGIAGSPADRARLAFNAGVDIDMVSQTYRQYLPTLVRTGQVSLTAVDNAVRRVLQAKQRLGLLDDPYRYSDEARQRANVLTPQHRALAREAAQKSIVLLKNTDALLPLSKHLRNVLVVGSLATDAEATLGPWTLAAHPEDSITVLQGIRRAVAPGTEVVYLPGASPISNETQNLNEVRQAARRAEVVIAVLGEHADQSGEARSRADLGLPGAQEALLRALLDSGKPMVILLMNGRPLVLSQNVRQAPALLETWFLGSEMGHAVADILFGDVNPSGKLPITFPRNVGQIPLYYAHKSTGRPPSGDERYTSGYIDEHWTPLYPFGFGLSYTSFSYSAPRLSTQRLASTQVLSVAITVTNTGARPGEEIVQLYLRDDVASVTRPVRQLRGFRKVQLAPGEARELTFTLDQADFALLDSDFSPVIEAGTFTVFVGADSTTENQARFELTDGRALSISGQSVPSPGSN